MTDIVTRLRALADDLHALNRYGSDKLVREAADALELALAERDSAKGHKENGWQMNAQTLAALERVGQERDALKAKLAEAKHDIDLLIRNDRAEKAEAEALVCVKEVSRVAYECGLAKAEAAALRAIAKDLCDYNAEYLDQMKAKEAWVTDGVETIESPFVARFRGALSQPGPGAALLERMKKLEAVAEAARARFEIWNRDTYAMLQDALADLEET